MVSKCAGEVVLEKVQLKMEIPIIVHHPTSIVGDSVSPTNMLAITEGLRRVPTIQYNKRTFGVMPVGVAARTVVRDALQPIKGISFSKLGSVKYYPIKKSLRYAENVSAFWMVAGDSVQ
jgi:hypothetical protein